jgi:poly(3-hydroxybutyrate) depolymerase
MKLLALFLLGRAFLLQLPDQVVTPVPLVVVLHPRGGNGEYIRGYFNFPAGRAIYAYPDAVDGSWNAEFCCEPSAGKVDDVGFIESLIDYISGQYPIDPGRVYVVGYSNGGMMANRLGAMLAHRLAAIVDVAGAVSAPGVLLPVPSERLSVLMVHGVLDEVVPYGGDQRYLSFSAGVDTWQQLQGYTQAHDADRSGNFSWITWRPSPLSPDARDRVRDLVAVTYHGDGHIIVGEDVVQLRDMVLQFIDKHPKR